MSMEMEIAKAQNEVKCARKDVEKASNRLAFVSSAIHNLKDRDIEKERNEIIRISKRTHINKTHNR